MLKLDRYWPWKTVSSHFHMPVRPMLLHHMALVSFRPFCKKLGNLQEFFGQMVYRPPLAKNCPYAYVAGFVLGSSVLKSSVTLVNSQLVAFCQLGFLILLCCKIYRFSQAKIEALDNIYSLLKQNIKSCFAKRQRQRERWKKTTIGLISKKNNFARAAHFLSFFLCRCFARPQSETSRNFLVTLFMEEMSCVLLFTFFHSLIFTWWPLGFLICSLACRPLYFFSILQIWGHDN